LCRQSILARNDELLGGVRRREAHHFHIDETGGMTGSHHRTEISGRPFGRIIQSAPFGSSEALSFSSRASSVSLCAPRKIASLGFRTRPIESSATVSSSSFRNP